MPPLELASPLTLLEESGPVSEALFLTYSAQLPFFERFALGAARDLRARVSVVADAARVSGDVGTVRRAGRRYLDGRVELAGRAFHPKLVVLAGEKGATVAIGSANLTLAGWHGNAEIWSVLRADSHGAPRGFRAVARFLADLPAGVSAGPGVPEALERAAARLAALEATEDGPEVVHSLAVPILRQLPVGPVDELHLHAPFYDAGLEALEALFDRLDPRRLDVYISPDTSVHGPDLERFLADREAHWHPVAPGRYHHGKLVEWVVGGRRFALTGSPNLSAPALLATAGDGGNVELGVITELESTLAPGISAQPQQPLRENRIERTLEPASGLTLLGAIAEKGGVRIVVGRPLVKATTAETYDGQGWRPCHRLPVGASDSLAPWPGLGAGPGTALRLRSDENVVSNAVFVTDLGAVTSPQIERVGKTRTDPAEVFSDLAVARAFAEDLARLREVLALRAAAGAGAGGGGGDAARLEPSEKLTAEEYLERCAASVGEAMIRFGLGLPSLSGAGPLSRFPSSPSSDGADEGDDPDPMDEEEAVRRIRDLPAYRRRRYRRWFGDLFRMAPELPLGGRLVVFNLALRAAAGNLWDEPRDWVRDFAAVASGLSDVEADSDLDEEARKASSVLALLVLDAHVERHAGDDPAREGFERLAAKLRERPPGWLEAEGLEPHATDVLALFGRGLYPGDIAEILTRVTNPPSELERAVSTLRLDFGIEARVEDGRLKLAGFDRLLRDPLLVALACTGADGRAVASLATDTGEISAIWERPELLLLRKTPRGSAGDLYHLPKGLRLPAPGASSVDLPKASCSWMPGQPVPEAAEALIARE